MSETAYVGRVWDFLEIGRQKLDTLSAVIESGDTVAVRSCSRALREQAATLGLGEVAQCAEDLETGAYNCCLAYTIVSYNRLCGKLADLKAELAQVSEVG